MFRVLRRLNDQRWRWLAHTEHWSALPGSDQTDSQPNDASFDLSFPGLIFLLHAQQNNQLYSFPSQVLDQPVLYYNVNEKYPVCHRRIDLIISTNTTMASVDNLAIV